MIEFKKMAVLTLACTSVLSGCAMLTATPQDNDPPLPDFANLATVQERFLTQRDENNNVDSVAVWQGEQGQRWLIATAKETDRLLVYAGDTGELVKSMGQTGTGMGEFKRPNGVSVVDDLLLVVERDNQRVQVLNLPSLRPVLVFGNVGDASLQNPYGLWINKTQPGHYQIYVTDNYETADEKVPPLAELDHRVQRWSLIQNGTTWKAKHEQNFGATDKRGALLIVESLAGDPEYNRLLIADEEEYTERNIKVYNLQGKFTGMRVGAGVFRQQPEGIALYACNDGSGYWVTTDQGKEVNYFHLFERESLDYFASFQGETTLNTDGIWLEQNPFPGFNQGAFYALHNDGNVAAFDWGTVLKAVNAKTCQ